MRASCIIHWLFVTILLALGCQPDVVGTSAENVPPVVLLPNSPPEGTTVSYRYLMQWIGNDPDGVVAGYSWRVDDGIWSHEPDDDGDWQVHFNAGEAVDLDGDGSPSVNWDGGAGILGVDDDADGKTDEELANGVDDDGDELIDEDTDSPPDWPCDDNGDDNTGYDPEPYVDEDPRDGYNNDLDELIDEDEPDVPRWCMALGGRGAWTLWLEATSDTVQFSTDSLGQAQPHTFEVKALDNDYAESEPASIVLNASTFRPVPAIVRGPADGATRFSLAQPTSTWPGVEYELGGSDIHRDIYYNIIEDGRVAQWSHRVDEGPWTPWSADSLVYLYGLSEGDHTFEVRCRDDAGAISDSIAMRILNVLIPTLDETVLLVDDTGRPIGNVRDDGAFYMDSLFVAYSPDSIQTPEEETESRAITHEELQRVRLLVWYKGDLSERRNLEANERILTEYVRIGGKLWLDGFELTGAFGYEAMPDTSEANILRDWLGIEDFSTVGDEGASLFTGVVPLTDPFEAAALDSFPQFASLDYTLSFIQKVYPADASEAVYSMTSREPAYEGLPCAVRWPVGGPTRVLYFGFPLLYMKMADARALADGVMESFEVYP